MLVTYCLDQKHFERGIRGKLYAVAAIGVLSSKSAALPLKSSGSVCVNSV